MASERALSYADALREATSFEMERNEQVFVLGLGVDDPIGLYGSTKGLHEEFGADRCFDTPISEDAMTGLAIGAAIAGMRPIHVHQRMDFLLLCMNQIINMASKMSYMTDGAVNVPIVIRAVIGRSWGQGAQHSQALHSLFMHIPGLKVVAPTTPHDAKGCLISAIRDNNPVIFMEHRMLYNNIGFVPKAGYGVDFGKARILTAGSDITIVAISHMVVEAIRATHLLADVGITAEVVDPISLTPLDTNTILNSARKTGNVLVVDTSWTSCGASAEILARIVEKGVPEDLNLQRLGFQETPCPTTRNLELEFYPSPAKIAMRCYQMLTGKADWTPEAKLSSELEEFKGPF